LRQLRAVAGLGDGQRPSATAVHVSSRHSTVRVWVPALQVDQGPSCQA